MFDLLQTAPDIIMQVADSTEIFSDPMRAILDSISVKTGQTALNTARDTVDWEIIGITRRDYYIAIAAIIVAVLSLIIEILTTAFQNRSAKNSSYLSARYTFDSQAEMAKTLIADVIKRIVFLITLKDILSEIDFRRHIAKGYLSEHKIYYDFEPHVLIEGTTLVINPARLKSLIVHQNEKLEILYETLLSERTPAEVKGNEIFSLIIDDTCLIERIDVVLIHRGIKDYYESIYNDLDWTPLMINQEYVDQEVKDINFDEKPWSPLILFFKGQVPESEIQRVLRPLYAEAKFQIKQFLI